MLIDMLSALSLIFMSEIRANYIPYEGTDILVMNVITCFHLFQEFPNNGRFIEVRGKVQCSVVVVFSIKALVNANLLKPLNYRLSQIVLSDGLYIEMHQRSSFTLSTHTQLAITLLLNQNLINTEMLDARQDKGPGP